VRQNVNIFSKAALMVFSNPNIEEHVISSSITIYVYKAIAVPRSPDATYEILPFRRDPKV
jgi:hypothetical protein